MANVAWQLFSIFLWGSTVMTAAIAVRLVADGHPGVALGVGLFGILVGCVAANCWGQSKAPARQPGEPDPTASVRPWRDR